MALFSRLFGGSGSVSARGSQVTTADRPFVMKNPAIGFLNLQGERGAKLAECDSRALSPLFTASQMSQNGVPRCDVLFVYCDINASGSVEGTSDSLRGLIEKAGAYVAVIATENVGDAYIKALQSPTDWHANLVCILDRKGPKFADFFRRLFERMNKGKSMLMAWVEIAPQIPGADNPDVPDSFMAAEAGHVTFR